MLHNTSICLKALLLFAVTSTISSCLKDPHPNPPNPRAARARVEITDAPIDDPNVKAVLITVVDVKVDGKSWAGFDGKTTFDLLAYQKGETKLLGEGELTAGAHTEIVLVLDTETDANGDSPGCYVRDAQDKKRKLEGGTQLTIKATGSYTAKANETTETVLDLDLRKCIVYKPGSDTAFQFVTDPELAAAVRLVAKASTGTILGDCTDGVSGSQKIIVYAYQKGAYNVNEKFPQGTSQVQFKNAVSSSVVAADGAFNLSFLESGSYELHFISYQNDPQGKPQAKGELQLNLLNSTLNLLQLGLSAKATLNLDVVVTGIVFF